VTHIIKRCSSKCKSCSRSLQVCTIMCE